MKVARFFPLAFIANVHGFILLAPYLVLFLTIVRVAQIYTARRESSQLMRLQPARIPVDGFMRYEA